MFVQHHFDPPRCQSKDLAQNDPLESEASSTVSVSLCRCLFVCFYLLFRAILVAHGGSQVRGLIQGRAAGLHDSHSHARSEPHLRPTPQFMAKPDSSSSFFFLSFCLFAFSRVAPVTYGGSQARGQIGVIATGLRHSHSNTGSEPCL